MKILTLIVHANAQRDLADQLRPLEQVSSFIFSHVEGHEAQLANDPLLSEQEKVVGYTPRVRVDILLEDNDLTEVLAMLRDTANSVPGEGIFWVCAVEQSGRL